MKQKKLIKKIYSACLDNDIEKQTELKLKQYKKILKRKEKNKPFNNKWTVI
jgi:hypothetical protein